MKTKLTIVFAIIMILVFCILPTASKDKIHNEAPALLEFSNFQIVTEGEYDFWHDRTEYVVKRDNKEYNVYVILTRQGVVVQPK